MIPSWPLGRWLVLSHVFVFLLPMVALVGSGALGADLRRQTVEDLDHQAALLELHIASLVARRGPTADVGTVREEVTTVLRAAKDRTLAGFRVVDTAGVVVASSGDGLGDLIADDAEVRAALRGGSGLVVRPRATANSREQPLSSKSRRASYRVFLAVPITVDDEIVGALVLSRTPREELQTLWQMAPQLVTGLGLTLAGTVVLAVTAGRVLSRSLRRLATAAGRIAGGSHGAIAELEPVLASRVLEARELAQAFGTMTGRLQERLGYIAEFAGNVSHEFKTPVSSLRGTVELLRDDDEMPPEQRARFLDNALADLDRLSRLVGGLLRLARAEEGTADRRVFLLDEVVLALAEKHPGLRVEGRAGRVDGNREQVEAALANLVENAYRHGGDGVTVTARLWAEGEAVGVDVVDDGPGISAANLPRVFDRFFTTNRAGGGTGLGLALVRAVARAHGGDVEVTSRPGETRLRFRVARGG